MKAILKKFFSLGVFISASYALNGGSMTYYDSKGNQTTAKSLLKPYYEKYNRSFESLLEEFSSNIGADRVIFYFSDAKSKLYDKKDFNNSDQIRANVIYGIVGLAYENEDKPGMRNVLDELTADISEMKDVYDKFGQSQHDSLTKIQNSIKEEVDKF